MVMGMKTFRFVIEKSKWDGGDWRNVKRELDAVGVFRGWEEVLDFIRRWVDKEEFVEDGDERYLWGWVEYGEVRFDFYVYEVEFDENLALYPADMVKIFSDIMYEYEMW